MIGRGKATGVEMMRIDRFYVQETQVVDEQIKVPKFDKTKWKFFIINWPMIQIHKTTEEMHKRNEWYYEFGG